MDKDLYLELLLRHQVLRFGAFTTKSGRQTPYFFNTGNIDSGESLAAVTGLYAALIAERFPEVENLYGPAYKGIPLAVMTAFNLSRRLGRDISFTFNRKEAKDHGEGGQLIGRSYRGGEKVVVVEDVVTGGTSFNESLPLLKSQGAKVIGLAVGVDRQERATGSDRAALAAISATWGIASAAIITIDEVIERLHNRPVLGQVWIDDAIMTNIQAYRKLYGAK